MRRSTRIDLFLGVSWGLATSLGGCAIALDPPGTDPWLGAWLALALLAGGLGCRLPRIGRPPLVQAVALASLLVWGAGISIVAAVVTAAAGRLGDARGRGRLRTVAARDVFLVAWTVVAASAAAVALLAVAGPLRRATLPGTGWVAMSLALAAHAAAWVGIRIAARRFALAVCGHRARPRRRLRALGGGLARQATAAAAGLAAATLSSAGPAGRSALVAALALAAAIALDRARAASRHERERARAGTEALLGAACESLVRAMGARERETPEHLGRVEALSAALARRLGLTEAARSALCDAARLHDLGKLGVAERVLNKPGRLSPIERRQMQRHPVVGAHILEPLPFSDDVASIVRHHHERWDGTGYPDGLAAEAIPLAARLLAVADCYDALTSDRPYRAAMEPDRALAYVRHHAGRRFDPRIVELLSAELARGGSPTPASRPVPRPRRLPGPPAREEADDPPGEPVERPAAGRLALSRGELDALYDIARADHDALDADDYLTLAAAKLRALLPCRALAVYRRSGTDELAVSFAVGHGAERLRRHVLTLGERVSGWAALEQRAIASREHRQPLSRDGGRSDLEAWSDDPELSRLSSALAAPLVADRRSLGALTLYDDETRLYTPDERRLLVAIAGHVARALARRDPGTPRLAPSLTDPQTGLPNARFLTIEVRRRLSRGEEAGFGLLAFQLRELDRVGELYGTSGVERVAVQLGRRLAASCLERETLVRFGPDLFLVLTDAGPSGDLVRRFRELGRSIEAVPLEPEPGTSRRMRLLAVHACSPADGATLAEVLGTLDARLALAGPGAAEVVPFPTAAAAREP